MDSVFYSQLLAVGLLINGTIPLSYLEAKKAIKEKYILSLISNLSKIPLMVFFTFYMGIFGLIFSKILSKIIGVTTIFILIRNLEKHD
jgi:hypothetical protein